VIHIDAHLDILPSYAGNKYTHASPIYRIINDLKFDPRRIHQIGVRGYISSKESYDYAKRIGIDLHPLGEVRMEGISNILDGIFDDIMDNEVYITFDVDSLDPSIAPGTGVLEPGGLNYDEARIIMKKAGIHNTIAADFVEVSPPLDHNDMTAKTVVYLIIDLLSSKFQS
jgi:guanidinopropionase